MNWSGLLEWVPFIVGVVTLGVIIYFNRRSIENAEETTEQIKTEVEETRELHRSIRESLEPRIKCDLEEASSEKFAFRITNISAVRFVVRAKLLINEDQELKVKFWNQKDVAQFLKEGEVDSSRLEKSMLLYPQIPASTTQEPGGPWAAHISPGESRVFSTSPFPAQRIHGARLAETRKNQIKEAGKEVEEFEREAGMKLAAEDRIPDQLKGISLDEIETVKVKIGDPDTAGPFLFKRGEDFNL
ncbi:hypothetical protein AKJ36_00190 [candidate division MSBL1 archaeon SCGC-AAA259I07]|uniref:Uncharacterized protein n=1 Tax=candidate division MSBL1 archaeon SCGC-AAA259I07 TaxID=1698266 RepID=A0A133UN61_9EURY|nr:hypothetical protein AKJ36_00190 [candidate division MSBL1 archaeon SCGC-AAA259I07]